MAYDEKYRAQAVAYKDDGHTFAELKKVFKICNYTYYKWVALKEQYGVYQPEKGKRSRSCKIVTEQLKQAIEEKPDAYSNSTLYLHFESYKTAQIKAFIRYLRVNINWNSYIYTNLQSLLIAHRKRCFMLWKNLKLHIKKDVYLLGKIGKRTCRIYRRTHKNP